MSMTSLSQRSLSKMRTLCEQPQNTFIFTHFTCFQPTVTDQDKQTPPPDSVTLTLSVTEIIPRRQTELYTAYQAARDRKSVV